MKNPRSIVHRALITEKGTQRREAANQYFFEVSETANKIEIKRAVEQLIGSKVDSVRTSITHGKIKRQGRFAGRRPDWKKAFVKLKAGEKIPEYTESA